MLPKRKPVEPDGGPQKCCRLLRLVIAWAIAIAVAAIILMVFRQPMVRAHEPPSTDGNPQFSYYEFANLQPATCRGGGFSALERIPATSILGYPGFAKEPGMVRPDRCDMNSVWATTLTAGRMTGGMYTFYGYAANGDTYFGGTGVADFHHNWRDYTVKALYYQEDNYQEDNYEEDYYQEDNYQEDNYEEDYYQEDYYQEDHYEEDHYEEDYYQDDTSPQKQLVLDAGTRLPDGLALRVDGNEFLISKSNVLSGEQTLHAWPLDEDPGWTEGQELNLEMTIE